MQVDEHRSGGVVILDGIGRMTRNEGFGIIKQRVDDLLKQGHRQLVLNLSEISYLDSTCVGELVSAFITVRNSGGVLKFCGASQRVGELLSIAKLDTVFEVYDTEAGALASFVAPGAHDTPSPSSSS